MKTVKLSGILGYVAVALWFLLTVLAPQDAKAASGQETRMIATPVSALAPQIEDALFAHGAPAGAEIVLSNPATTIGLIEGAPPKFTSISYSRRSGRFVIRAQSSDEAFPVAIAGVVRATRLLPVLSRGVERGEVIAESDIDWVETDEPLLAGVLETDGDLIGKVARRPLPSGVAIRRADVAAQTLIKKGALVTMVIERRGLRLTHTGVAKENGAAGELIAIENPQSEQTVKAVVVGENLAKVPMATRPLL